MIIALMRGKDYVPLTLFELSAKLGLERKDNPRLKKLLAQMLSEGSVAKVKGDKYGASADLDLVGGVIDFRQSGWAFLRTDGGSSAQIEIRPEDTGVALNGDKVLARILHANADRWGDGAGRRRGKKPSKPVFTHEMAQKKRAKVIRILERKTDKMVGTLKRSYNFWHVVPDDPRFFYDVLVEDPAKSTAFPKPKDGDKVIVRLNEWRQRHINPSGVVVENLGESHTAMAEYKGILAKYDLSETFPDAVLKEVGDIPEEVSKRDIDGRLDLRGEFVITIDPEDAKDFDDAISIKRADTGGWEIGVHIADVSYYVRPNSLIDKEARERGNSTYLVGTVIPMLPFELSNGVCSLVEDKDRLVKSVFMTYDAGGDCKGVRFANSVIRSVKRLSYEQAHAFITEDDLEKIAQINPPADYETAYTGKPLSELSRKEMQTLRTLLRQFWSVASTLRQKRMRKGSLDLDMPDFKIFVDKDGYADRIVKEEYNESHQLIEEFMLAANEAVARELFSHHIPYISRVHEDPDPEKLNELRDELESFDIKVGDLTSRREVMRLLAVISRHPQSYILKTKFLRSLKRANYKASPDGHYGLNKVYYAHFTSPIRRYADLTVHRNLNFLFKEKNMPYAPKGKVTLATKAMLDHTAEHISRTEQNSAEAERDSRKIKLMEYFERNMDNGMQFEAVITSLSNHGFFVELTESMAFGFVHIHSLRDDIYHLNDAATELRGRKSGRIIKIGDRIQVEVESVDRFKRQIDFRIAGSDDLPQRPLQQQQLKQKKQKGGKRRRNK